jgi:hypothetical protein
MIRRWIFFLLVASGFLFNLLAQTPESQLTLQQTGRVVDKSGKGIGNASVEIYDILDAFHIPDRLERIGSITTSPDGSFSFKRIPPKPEVCCSLAVAIAPDFGFHWTDYDADTKEIPEIMLEQPPATITGQVVDSQNKPIPQATVHAFIRYGDNKATFAIGSTHLGMATTDAQGRFAITDIPRDAGVELCAEAKDFSPTYTFRTDDNLTSLQYRPGQEVRIVLHRPGSLACSVVHKDGGAPIPDVCVYAVRVQGPENSSTYWSLHYGLGADRNLSFNGDEGSSGKTDATGQTKIDGLKPGEYWVCMRPVVVATQGWYYTREKITVPEGSPASCTLYAVRPGILRFRVLQGDQKPVEGATVSSSHDSDDSYAMMLSGADANAGYIAITKADGYAESRVPPGTYHIRSISKDNARVPVENRSLRVEAGQTQTMTLTFDPQPGLAGTCLDPDGQPVARAEVYFLHDPISAVRTNDKGQFLFRNYTDRPVSNDAAASKKPGSIRSEALLPDPTSSPMAPGRFLVARHDLKKWMAIRHYNPGETIVGPIQMKLQPAFPISGAVVNDQNQPIPGAVVTVTLAERIGSTVRRQVPFASSGTKPDGSFGFLVLPYQGYDFQIAAQAEGLSRRVKVLTANPQSVKDTIPEIQLPGKPSPVDLGPFSLTDSQGSVSGIVVDKLGRPLKQIRISLKSPEQAPHKDIVTDQTGLFAFEGLAPGKVRISASIVWQGTSVVTETGVSDLRMVLTLDEITPDMISPKSIGGGAVEVRLVDSMTKEPVLSPQTELTVQQPHGNDIDLTADKDGIVRFCVGPGRHKIGCQTPNYSYHSENVIIENGKLNAIVLKIQPDRELTETREFGERQRPIEGSSSSQPNSSQGSFQILVRDRSTRLPIPGAKLVVTGTQDQSRYEATTGIKGYANLTILTAGYYLVESVSAQGYKVAGPKKSNYVSIPDSQPMSIDLEQIPVFAKVRVLNEQNQPVSKIWVWHCFRVGEQSENMKNARTDETGIAELEWLYESPEQPAQIEHILQVQSDKSGEGTMAVEVVRSHPGQVLEIHYQKRVIPRVRVLDATTTPIVGISLGVYLAPNIYGIFGGENKTDAAGIFTGEPIPVGREWFLNWNTKKGRETFNFTTAESPDGIQNLPDLVIQKE